MKRLKRSYNIVLTILFIGILNLIACHSNKIRLEVPIVNRLTNTDFKKGHLDDAFINSLDCKLEKQLPNGDYVLSYEVAGYFIKEKLYAPFELKKVYLSEYLADENGVDIINIQISPVRGMFFGKAPGDSILAFHFKNEYLLKKTESDSISRIRFLSGDKEQIIELRQKNK